jgi:cellulose synthase/poly-beta-1,6-N-acetylglucosamine synthase-like glycosyltransferase
LSIIAITIVSTLIIFILRTALHFRRFVSRLAYKSLPLDELPVPISVIIPCKGDDGRLFGNLKDLVNQDYSAAEFVLVTALANDPAQVVFNQLQTAYPAIRIKTVVAGISPLGSEKNNNLLKAVAASDPSSEILVFLDSDGKSDRHLIRRLVSGLLSSSVAGVSGYRWYQPRWYKLPEVVRSAWNAAGCCNLANPHISQLWGGAMAFRRKTFEEARFSEIWATSISTDAPLRVRLEELGLKTLFLPNCIVLSSEKDSWGSVIQFITRQTLMGRIYQKPFFWFLFVLYVIGNILGFGLFIGGLMRGISGGGLLMDIAGFLWISQYWLYVALIMGPNQQMLKASGLDVKMRVWIYQLISPLVGLIEIYSCIYCLFAKRVRWAGVTYQLHNQTARRL